MQRDGRHAMPTEELEELHQGVLAPSRSGTDVRLRKEAQVTTMQSAAAHSDLDLHEAQAASVAHRGRSHAAGAEQRRTNGQSRPPRNDSMTRYGLSTRRLHRSALPRSAFGLRCFRRAVTAARLTIAVARRRHLDREVTLNINRWASVHRQ